MSFFILFAIAVGLAMDSLSLSVLNGVFIRKFHFNYAFKLGLFFGGFQGLMPLIGWRAGNILKVYIQPYDHWVAFIILIFIGGKLMFTSSSESKSEIVTNMLKIPTLIALSFATSIDALAVGISFAVLDIGIILPIILISAVTFTFCFFGVFIGNRYGKIFGNKLEIVGGIIIICIGIKIFIEHILKNI